MQEAETFSLLPEQHIEAQPIDSYLPVPDAAPPTRVPKNIEEVSSQIALAQEARGTNFAKQHTENISAIKAAGTGPLLAQVLEADHNEKIDAAKQQALGYAQAQDVARAEAAAREVQEAERRKAVTTPENDPEAAHKAVAQRALENVTGQSEAERLYKDMRSLNRTVDQAADDVTTRNILAREAGAMDDQASVWNKVTQFGRALIPFMDDVSLARAVGKVIGRDLSVDKMGAITDFRNYMLGLDVKDREVVVKKLIGELSSNPAVSADALRQIAELTKAESNAHFGFNALGVTDVAAVFHGLSSLARKGVPLKAVRDVAGEKQAGEMAAQDLVAKGKLTGLNDDELVARVIAGGVSPLEADPAALKGLSPHAQQKLIDDWNSLLSGMKERLNSSSLSPEEVQKAAAQIRDSWMQTTNKRVFHVEFGEASADGQQLNVLWQGADGHAFTSKEAAEAFAKERGLVSFEIVPKNAADLPVSVDAVRAAAPNMAEEVRLIQKAQLPRLERQLDSLKTQLDDLEKNYVDREGSAMMDRFMLKQELELYEDLVERARKFGPHTKYHETEEWFQNLDQLGPVAPQPVAKPVKAQPQSKVMAAVTSRASKGEMSMKHVLDELAKNSEDTSYRFLAKRLLSNKAADYSKVPFKLVNEIAGAHPGATGGYNPGSDIASLRRSALQRGVQGEEILLHEAIHSSNSQVIALVIGDPKRAAKVLAPKQIAAVKELQTLHTKLRTMFDKGEMGALDTRPLDMVEHFRSELLHKAYPDELLSYGLTRPEYKELFNELKLSDLGYGSNEATVWSKLWQLFKDILGIQGDDTVLAKVYSVFDNLASETTEHQRSYVSTFRKDGKWMDVRAATNPTGEYLVKESRNDPLSYSAVGRFSKQDIESMPFVAVDPKHGASEQGLEARVVGVHAEARTKAQLQAYIEPYYKGLSKDQVRKVQAVLEEGDAFSNAGSTGREFTFSEVQAKGLNEQEATAYLATRQLRMAMYHIRNGEMVRHLRAQGLKEIELKGAGIKTAGRVLDTDGALRLHGSDIYDTTTQRMVKLDQPNDYAAGKRVVELAHPTKIDGELRRTLLVDHSTATSRDITTALHYRPGEFSRIYTDEYFITMKRNVTVDGVPQVMHETIRTAKSVREAEAFTKAVGEAAHVLRNTPGNVDRRLQELIGDYFDVSEFKTAFKDGDLEGLTSLDFHYTRNKEEYLNGSVNEALSNGRLFNSKRSGRLYSVDRSRENSMGVFESLQAEMTNVSRVANIAQWRETMVRRWMNTFGDLIPAKTGNDVADFYAAAGAKFTKNTPEAIFAERTHKYIMRQIGLRTSEERYYEQLTRRMTEKFFKGGEGVESVGAKVRQMGMLGFMRNINFNFTLGMFNPAQLLVQANGAATALILSPLHGLAAAKTFPLLRMALMSDNPTVWRGLAKFDIGGSSDDFVKLVKAVRQTGILDNLKSTSLYNLEDGKLNIFGAYPQKVMGSHTFFFNRGEEFSRLVSFDVARREFQKAHPELDWTSKEALHQIVVRMDDLTQNMTKANLARFQEGAASIPLQFAQYNIKLAANIMSSLLGKGEGRGFTKPEALKLLAGHILLYGAAGNGLSMLVDEMSKDAKDSMSVDAKTYLAQGLVGGLVAQVGEWFTGERTNIALGSRLGSFDYYQKLADAIFTDPKNVYEALMGPSVSTAKRLGVIGDVAYLWWKDPELTPKDILDGLSTMGTEQVATLRNAAKAYLYHQHANKMLDKNGFPIAQLTPMEVLGQALGFQPTAAVDVSNLIKSKKDHDQAINDIAKTIFQVQKNIMTARAAGNHEYADEQHKLLQALWPINTGDLMEVQRQIRDKLYPYDNQMQKLLGEYLYKGQTYDKPLVVTQEPRKE